MTKLHTPTDLFLFLPILLALTDSVKQSGGRVLVHCQAGISRSATICLAYLMHTQRVKLDEAFDFIKQRRQVISPNLAFMGQLLQFETDVLCRGWKWENIQTAANVQTLVLLTRLTWGLAGVIGCTNLLLRWKSAFQKLSLLGLQLWTKMWTVRDEPASHLLHVLYWRKTACSSGNLTAEIDLLWEMFCFYTVCFCFVLFRFFSSLHHCGVIFPFVSDDIVLSYCFVWLTNVQ